MTRLLRGLAIVAWSMSGVGAARADDGAWTSFLTTSDFTDLLVTSDEVWGATSDAGLLRFDRQTRTFTTVRREPGSIASNSLTSLALDARGRLWAGTRGAGATRRAADGSRWDRVNVLDGLPTDTVSVVEADGDTVWIGTTQGIAIWNGTEVAGSLPDGNTVSFDTTFVRPGVVGIAVVGDTIWLSTRSGVGFAHISSGATDWRPANQGLPPGEPLALASNGRDVFLHTSARKARWDQTAGRWEFDSSGDRVHGMSDDNGEILIVDEGGVGRWTDAGWVRVPGALGSTPADGDDPEAAIGADGLVFIGAPERLLEEVTPGSWQSHDTPGGPIVNELLNVAVQDDRVYVVTNGRGLSRLDGTLWRDWNPGFCGTGCDTTFWNPNFVLGFFVDHNGRKWAGAWGEAIDMLDDSVNPPVVEHAFPSPHSSEFVGRHTLMVSGASDSIGNIWIGLDTDSRETRPPLGLDLYNEDGVHQANYNPQNTGMAGSFVRQICVAQNGRVFLGYTNAGVDYFTPTTLPPSISRVSDTAGFDVRGLAAHGESLWVLSPSELRRYSAFAVGNFRSSISIPGGQDPLALKPLAISANGTVWVATGAGLRAYEPGGGTRLYTTANSPLTSDLVRSIDIDHRGHLWIATAAGLSRFDPGFVETPDSIDRLSVRVYPNPITITGAGLSIRLAGDATAYRGEIYDVTGRRVRRFPVTDDGDVFWDGRDDEGTLVEPGIYFVRATAGGREAVARIVLLR